MNYKIYQVDAFTNEIFHGNPACVIQLEHWLSNDLLLNIAQENGVSETAFFIVKKDSVDLRWFTPDIEIDLCGHATLATAHIIKTVLKYSFNKIVFNTMSGHLIVECIDGFYFLNFPTRKAIQAPLPIEIKKSLNIQPKEVYKARDYMLIYQKQSDIENIIINRYFFDQINLGYGGVILTSIGNQVDFVSRFFTPQATILEDPVTGSAHCTLIPYWSNELNKKKLIAHQISKRGGVLNCIDLGDRVSISGQAKIFSIGEIFLK